MSWRYYFVGVTCWMSVHLCAADVQISAWQAAYDAELHCDIIATHNALIKLQGYRETHLVQMTTDQQNQIRRTLSQLVLPKPVPFLLEDRQVVTDIPKDIPRKSFPRKMATEKYSDRRPAIKMNRKTLLADLLRRANKAFEFGQLQEAEKLYQLVLKLKPDSVEAKKGLAKIGREMN